MVISSRKNMTKAVMSAMASGQGYVSEEMVWPTRHSLPRASLAGASKWMNAVAMMTPDPKYLATKKVHAGTSLVLARLAKVGKMAPSEC